jgi:hypothetical protein
MCIFHFDLACIEVDGVSTTPSRPWLGEPLNDDAVTQGVLGDCINRPEFGQEILALFKTGEAATRGGSIRATHIEIRKRAALAVIMESAKEDLTLIIRE